MVRLIKHSEIKERELKDIIEIKQRSWDYSYESHISWINSNLNDTDLHFLYYKGEELISYLNLVRVKAYKEGEVVSFYGVGNVCTKYKGVGDGSKMMKELNLLFRNEGWQGLLFCKEKLVDFYSKNGWVLFENLADDDTIFTMVNNYCGDSDLNYNDRLF
jgi:hypothetical protein